MKKIKILHVKRDLNSYTGLVEMLTILAQKLDRDRFDLGVCVFRYEGNTFGEKFRSYGGKIYNLNINKNFYNEPNEFIKLCKFMIHYRPDIVQTHVLKANLYGIVAAKLARVPIIIGTEMTLKDIAPSGLKRLRDRLIHPIIKKIAINYCDKFIVVSRFIMQEWFPDYHSDKIEVLYPPFCLEKYNLATNSSSYPENTNCSTIGFVGRLSEEKGIPSLLQAMVIVRKRIADVRLIIVGTGPLENKLREMTTSLGLNSNVHFVGFKENVFEILGQMNVFVLPSRTEACPIVVLEAMAMGLPVVASHVGGIPELVRDSETGILFPYNNPTKMAEALIDLLQDKEKAKMMGKKGKEIAFEEFHPSKFVNRLQDLYLQLYEKVPQLN